MGGRGALRKAEDEHVAPIGLAPLQPSCHLQEREGHPWLETSGSGVECSFTIVTAPSRSTSDLFPPPSCASPSSATCSPSSSRPSLLSSCPSLLSATRSLLSSCPSLSSAARSLSSSCSSLSSVARSLLSSYPSLSSAARSLSLRRPSLPSMPADMVELAPESFGCREKTRTGRTGQVAGFGLMPPKPSGRPTLEQ